MDLLSDLRYAARHLRTNVAFTTVAVATLGLGIGVNAAVFGILDAVLLRPLPYAEPEQLVAVQPIPGASTSKRTLLALRERTRAFEGMAGWSWWGFTLTDAGEPTLLTGARATADLFDVLGATPALGRTFDPEHGQAGNDRVAVLAHRFWRDRFGSDPGIVGREITLDGGSVSVLGVMPRDFQFPAAEADLWLPAAIDPADANDFAAGYLTVVGRLAPDVSLERATADLRAATATLRADEPGRHNERFGVDASVVALRDSFTGDVRPALLLLLGAVAFVLLIACVNLAGLLLARATGRRRELAVRVALGASRGRIVRQLLTESLLLAALGGVVGVLLAAWTADAIGSALVQRVPVSGSFAADPRILAFAMIVTVLAALLSGALPAWRATAGGPSGSLHEGSRGGTGGVERRRLMGGLVIGEVALSVVLVIAAGLALRSLWELRSEDIGIDADRTLAVEFHPAAARYEQPDARRSYMDRVRAAVARVPGVEAVGFVHLLPLGGSNWNPELIIDGRETAPGADLPDIDWRVASAGYFEAAGIPLLRGRSFDDTDRDGPNVALISSTAAKRFFPDEDPIGRRVRTFLEGRDGWTTIVGVVADTRDQAVTQESRPQLYRPFVQHPMNGGALLVRVAGVRPERVAAPVREAMWSVDGDVPIRSLRAFADVITDSVGQPRLVAWLLAAFGALALLLGAIGIYGVMAFAVGSRTREIGVRIAVGARPADLGRMVLADALRLTAAGLALGVAGAAVAAHLLRARLHEVTPLDPITFGAAILVLATVALLAAVVPATRAMRVTPLEALARE